jgi:hypothetical protein
VKPFRPVVPSPLASRVSHGVTAALAAASPLGPATPALLPATPAAAAAPLHDMHVGAVRLPLRQFFSATPAVAMPPGTAASLSRQQVRAPSLVRFVIAPALS